MKYIQSLSFHVAVLFFSTNELLFVNAIGYSAELSVTQPLGTTSHPSHTEDLLLNQCQMHLLEDTVVLFIVDVEIHQ